MTSPIDPHPLGVVIRVKAHAGARRSAFAGLHAGALRVDVAAAPEKGKANQAIVALLANAFKIRKSTIELLSGHANSRKRFLLPGVAIGDAESRLAALMADGR